MSHRTRSHDQQGVERSIQSHVSRGRRPLPTWGGHSLNKFWVNYWSYYIWYIHTILLLNMPHPISNMGWILCCSSKMGNNSPYILLCWLSIRRVKLLLLWSQVMGLWLVTTSNIQSNLWWGITPQDHIKWFYKTDSLSSEVQMYRNVGPCYC